MIPLMGFEPRSHGWRIGNPPTRLSSAQDPTRQNTQNNQTSPMLLQYKHITKLQYFTIR